LSSLKLGIVDTESLKLLLKMLKMLKLQALKTLTFTDSSLQDVAMETAQHHLLFKHYIHGYHQMELNMEDSG